MQLRRSDLARLTGFGNDLTALDSVTALHQKLACMSIGGDVAVGVADENKVAVTLELIPGIGNDAVFRRLNGCTLRHRKIDAVIGLAVGLGAIAGDDFAANRPAERW